MSGRVRHRFADRVAETAAVLFAAAAIGVLLSGARGGVAALPDARPSAIEPSALADFTARLDAARVIVDTNRQADDALAALKDVYARRHEVWALCARYNEARSQWGTALHDYAYAVRLEPAYLDEGSPLFLGDRIGRLVERRVESLLAAKSSGAFGKEEAAELKTAYFLKRRLAGGCE